MITKEELIEKLNGDLAYEYAAAVQYVQHAAVIAGPQYQSIQKELVVHVTEEMDHANQLAEQIDYLGGVPTIEVDERKIADDAKTMLKQDLDGERTAIKRYNERIAEAQELKLYGLEQVLKGILAQEEEHERDIMDSLGE